MAAPQLKKTAVVAPTRKLINSGVVPTKQVKLKGSNGQVIQPKAPTPLLKPKAPTRPAEKEKKEAPAATEETKVTPPPVEEKAAPAPASEETKTPTPVAAPESPQADAAAKETTEPPTAAAEEISSGEEATPTETAPAAEESPATEETSATEETPAAEEAPEAEAPPAGPTPEELEAQKKYEEEMAEYNRQMEEYNRQVAEYERQLAEAKAAEEAADSAQELPAEETNEAEKESEPESDTTETPSLAETSTPEATPAPVETPAAKKTTLKPTAAKPALKAAKPGASLLKKSGATPPKKATAAVPAPPASTPDTEAAEDTSTPADPVAGMVEAMREVDKSYVDQLRAEAAKKPIYKSMGFLISCVALLAVAGVCGYVVIKDNQEKEAKRIQNEKTMNILRRAQQINKEGVDNLADAKERKINVSCTPEEIQFLMDIIVNPGMKDEKGKPMFGGHPEGVAQLACMLVGIASEENDALSKIVFDRLDKDAQKIKPSLYKWTIDRLSVTNIKGLNSKLHKLATAVSKQGDAKSFPKRGEILSIIWEGMGLRVTEKDIKQIIQLLREPDVDPTLSRKLVSCLDNIIMLTDDKEKKAELGDRIFKELPKGMRPDALLIFAKSCSPKALEYYKDRVADMKNWRTDFMFFSNNGSDDVLPIIEDMRAAAADDEKNLKLANDMLRGLFTQNHDRTPEMAKKMLSMVQGFDKIDMNTDEWQDVNWKTDPNSADFVGEDSPEYPELMKKREELKASRDQKMALVSILSSMYDHTWVTQLLEKFAAEQDAELSNAANKAIEKTRKNRAEYAEMLTKYRARDKS